jgi:hypothetical protein
MKLVPVHAIFLNERLDASPRFGIDHPGGELPIKINLFIEFETPRAHRCCSPAQLDSLA